MQRTVLAELDEIAIARARWDPHDATSPPLAHERARCVYVLEGLVAFAVGGLESEIGPRTLIYVPSGVAHACVVAGGEAHVLELWMPGAAGEVVVRAAAGPETVEVLGNRIAFLLDAEETGGAIGAIEFLAPRSFAGPPPHIHRRMHDVAVVLEGTMAFHAAPAELTARYDWERA